MGNKVTKIFCPNCFDDRDCSKQFRNTTYVVRGRNIEISEPHWVCSECGESVIDEAFGDPLDRAYAKYRHEEGLLSPHEIKRIRERWGLTQSAFARLFGMSPATISRYECGALQDFVHDALLRACDNREFMDSHVTAHYKRVNKEDLAAFYRIMGKDGDVSRDQPTASTSSDSEMVYRNVDSIVYGAA